VPFSPRVAQEVKCDLKTNGQTTEPIRDRKYCYAALFSNKVTIEKYQR